MRINVTIRKNVIVRKNDHGEYEVPTVIGISGSDAISYEATKEDALDAARYHHGQDAEIVIRRGTYSIN